jgi:hypothetical protein
MRRKVLVISFLIFIIAGTCFAHANEYSQDAGAEYTSELGNEHSDNMYAVSSEKSSSDEVMDHSLGRSDLIVSEPAHEEAKKKMDHEEGSHSTHTKEIKISEHEWVSTSQKGYGPAAGITLIAGLFFGIVMIRRS